MSRLEAVAVGLYYPTPEPIVAAIGRLLHLPAANEAGAGARHAAPYGPSTPVSATALSAPTVRLLDPCAGKGRALALLAEELRASERTHPISSVPTTELYGIEPNTERALEAQTRIPNLLVTSYFTATLTESGFQLAFVNPPYDTEAATDAALTGGRRERLEVRFLRRTTTKLAPDGVLIWIVPQRLLRDGAKHLAEHYRDLACWRFPDTPWRPPEAAADAPTTPMYSAFGQVVLIGMRRRVPVPADSATLDQFATWAALGAQLEPLPLEPVDPGQHELLPLPQSIQDANDRLTCAASNANANARLPIYQLPQTLTPLRYFLAATFDPDVLAAQVNRPGAGVWGERGYCERHWPDLTVSDLGIGQPLAPLRRGHLALLAAAGIANGQELVGTDGRRLVVKGACRKVTVREQNEERDATSCERVKVVTETERFEVALWAIDVETGEVLHIR